jgi:hypothetical protein
VDVFCAHETVTEPEPVPPLGETVSQEPLPEADQLPPWHPEGEPATVTNWEPLLALGLVLAGLMEKLVHVGAVVPA